MKIWYQSLVTYGYEKVWEEYGKTLEEQCRRVVRPNTEVYVTGIPVMVKEIDRFRSLFYYHKIQVLNNMLRAEKEGYDAFVIGCTFDGGLEEGREMLSIPVVGISQTSYHVARMLGRLFATVTTGTQFLEHYRQQIDHYGLRNSYLPGPYIFTASSNELALALKNPNPIIEKFKAVAEKAVADGASVIIPHPAFLACLTYKTGLTRVGDALVLDTVTVAVKMAEMLVDLKKIGIEVSRIPWVYGSPGKDLLKESLKKYAPVFKMELPD